MSPNARGIFLASGVASGVAPTARVEAQPAGGLDERTPHSGVRALGPCSPPVHRRTSGHAGPRLEVVLGDITTERVHAVVNAANTTLMGGGGVDGAIHRAAGPGLQAACRTLGGCAFGDAKATPAFALAARFVIHTVGPIWQGGDGGEARLLASCYRRCLEVADELGARSVAFPAISTGVYRYPVEEATRLAVRTVRSTLTEVELVRFVCFDAAVHECYSRTLAA